MASTTQPQLNISISQGENTQQVEQDTHALLQAAWSLDDEQSGIKKTYFFKTYTKALDFVQIVGIRSKSKNHHSVMTIRTGSVEIHWTTHHPRGLSAKDTFMARYCDDRAREIGTVDRQEALNCAPTKPAVGV